MRRWSLLGAVILAVGASLAHGEETEGIRWDPDLDRALLRAATEGRPVFLAINALENEGANQRLAHELYRSASWGEASRDYVCLVANSNEHAGAGGACTRYAGIPCETHRKVMFLAYRVLGLPGDVAIISPQHLILDPDGRLAWRKEYYTGVVGPQLLESVLPRISPMVALDRAARLRGAEIERLEKVPQEELETAARGWMEKDDPLAAAGVLNAIDYALDDARRLALVRAFASIRRPQLPVALVAAYETSLAPDQDADLALAYAEALLEADRDTGVRLLARIAVRTEDAQLRDRALKAWFGKAPSKTRLPDGLTGEERAAAAEVYALLGRGDVWGGKGEPPASYAPRLARARVLGAAAGGKPVDRDVAALGEVLADEDAQPGAVARALLAAAPSDVKAAEARVRPLFRESPYGRVRTAAAVAMLGAGLDEAGRVARRIWAAVQDPIEGPDVRAAVVRRLGEDPGWSEEAWLEALTAALARKGGAK